MYPRSGAVDECEEVDDSNNPILWFVCKETGCVRGFQVERDNIIWQS